MRSPATARLIAINDITCEFLLAFFRSQTGTSFEKLKKDIEIDKDLLDSKISLLKDAGLISNHTIQDEEGKVIDRIFSLTPLGENSLIELGYSFKNKF